MARLGRAARVRSETGTPAPALADAGQCWTLLPVAAYAGASSTMAAALLLFIDGWAGLPTGLA